MKWKQYGLSIPGHGKSIPAQSLRYEPPQPRRYRPRIALIGCGGIAAFHLRNYRAMGLDVALLCDLNLRRADDRAREFYPEATRTTDYREALTRDDIEVVDVATHPAERVPVLQAALRAGKHVLSQKPFVLNLAVGEKLANLADECGVRLAVNQNGRWAPHWSYLTQLVRRGSIGQPAAVDFTVAWDHSWVRHTPFNTMHQLVLYDFAVHWFDIATVFLGGRRAKSVFAQVTARPGRLIAPPTLVAVVADYGDAQARWSFNADNMFGQCDHTLLCGSRGTAMSTGPSLSEQTVTVNTARGVASPELPGTWFTNGFQGAMGELLCAIEEGREPAHSARNNLKTLELVFAAIASAESGRPMEPGEVRKLSGKLLAHCRPSKL